MIWFETGDLFVHFNWNLHPTGIQRVGLEILRAARADYGDRVGFCRLSRHTGRFAAIDFTRILAASAAPEFGEAASRNRFASPVAVARQLRRFVARYPKTVLLDYLRGRRAERDFEQRVKPGDTLVCLGLPWGSPSYGSWIAAAKRRYGIHFALLVHDVIPFTSPELCQDHFAAGFRRWFGNVLPVCDLLFVSSIFCRDAIRTLCRQRDWPVPPIERIPFGAGFTHDPPSAGGVAIEWPDRFVLFVSSIDRRKNHPLLLRVWRLLSERHGADAMPSLVFLGVGGNVGTVLAEIGADPLLRDQVTMIRGASDAVLREAYRRCLFTVYPSLTEGWGLPVAESLAYGKFCIVSNRASLPEVGGDLVDYIDPANDAGALAKFERVLFEPGYLAARAARIASAYRAPSWRDCAAALIARIDQAAGAASAASPIASTHFSSSFPRTRESRDGDGRSWVPAFAGTTDRVATFSDSALPPAKHAEAPVLSFDERDIEADIAREIAHAEAEREAAVELAGGMRLDQFAEFRDDELIRLGYAGLLGRLPSIAEMNRDRQRLARGLAPRDFLDEVRLAASGVAAKFRRRRFG